MMMKCDRCNTELYVDQKNVGLYPVTVDECVSFVTHLIAAIECSNCSHLVELGRLCWDFGLWRITEEMDEELLTSFVKKILFAKHDIYTPLDVFSEIQSFEALCGHSLIQSTNSIQVILSKDDKINSQIWYKCQIPRCGKMVNITELISTDAKKFLITLKRKLREREISLANKSNPELVMATRLWVKRRFNQLR